MKFAETVTFGGGQLERAAHLRAKASELAQNSAALWTVLWRGKPLIASGELALVPTGHPLLSAAGPGAQPILLGLRDGAPLFACDVSAWVPAEFDETALNTFLDPTEQRHPDAPEGAVFAELRTIMTRLSPWEAEVAATAKAVLHWHRSHGYCAACGAPSRLAMGGWQRDCAACGAKHFPRTDPVVIMLITQGDAVLLGRSPGWPEGMYSCLAGFVEPGETIEAAVRREVFEEAGVKVGDVRYLASQPWPFPASLMFGCWGEALSRDITIDPTEIEAARWVGREELALAFSGQHPEILPARQGAIAHFLLHHWLADQLD